MIPFFRKIRKQLAFENNAQKYMRYAIGEIALVVIGILIALQINDWNETRKDHKMEQKILKGLKNEFENNLSSVKKDIVLNVNSSNASQKISDLIYNNKLKEDSNILDSLLVQITLFGSFDAKTGFSDEIINSGRLNLIKNQELKVLITQWSGVLNDADEDILFRMENYNLILMPFLVKYFPLRQGELYKDLSHISKKWIKTTRVKAPFKPKWNQLDLMEFDNVLWHHKHSQDWVIMNDYEIEKFITETIDLINNEINKATKP